jgi:ABC-type uncharacterized transport system auxiliary subunit
MRPTMGFEAVSERKGSARMASWYCVKEWTRNARSFRFAASMALGAIAISAIAGGCGAARPVKYYQLTVKGDMTTPSDANALPITLLVGPLVGSHLYRDDRIVYSSGEAMGMYDSHRWSSAPTEMMQEVLFRELRASGKYKAVNTLRSNARGDYILNGRLYDFKEVTGSSFVARVAVEYDLRDLKTGATVWSHYYSHDEPVSGKEVSAVASAMDRNVQGIVTQVQASLAEYFQQHPPASSNTAGKPGS